MVGVKNGAFATAYFVLFNNHVASSITAQGRELTQTMDKKSQDYWYNQWHLDYELHKLVSIKNVKKIGESVPTSIYGDTDSMFISFKPAMDHCDWKNLFFNNLEKLNKTHLILKGDKEIKTDNPNCLGVFEFTKDVILPDVDIIIVDGKWIKNRDFEKFIIDNNLGEKIKWNWSNELDFIQGLDYYRYAGYFKKCLEEYAASYGVENKEDFELERISESVIYLAKKKYIQNIVH